MADDMMRVVPPEILPRPAKLIAQCPQCGADIEYEPAEDDAGAFTAMEDWPICEACEIVIDVPTVAIVRVDQPYWAGRWT